MNEAETKLDGTVPEEIFFIDGKWKITQKTAKDVNNLLKTIANKGNITYHIEWIPGNSLHLCVNFESMERDIYMAKGVKPLEVVQKLLSELNS